MKLTKSKLKQIIKEELEEVAGVGLSGTEADPDFSNSQALRDDLESIMEKYGEDVKADIMAALTRD